MSHTQNRRKEPQERGQKPLWFAIAGLLISVFSYGMGDMQLADVVFWFGGVFAGIALIYWFVQPTHGM